MSDVAVVPRDTTTLGLPGPTFDGFKAWVSAVMGVPSGDMPSDANLEVVYCQALNLAYNGLASIPSNCTSTSIYEQAVYNLGGAMLVEYAVDNPNSTYWQDLRNRFGIYNFTGGLINQAHDQGTGEGTWILPFLSGLTMFSFQLLKTPWGRAYLMFAGQWGPLWGITY